MRRYQKCEVSGFWNCLCRPIMLLCFQCFTSAFMSLFSSITIQTGHFITHRSEMVSDAIHYRLITVSTLVLINAYAWNKFNHSLMTDFYIPSKLFAFDPFPIIVNFIKTFSGRWIGAHHNETADLLSGRKLKSSQWHSLSANWEMTALTSFWKQMVAHQWRTSCRQVSHYSEHKLSSLFWKVLSLSPREAWEG